MTETIDVYLISRVQWQPMMLGQRVVPASIFKIGFAGDPFERMAALKTASAHNLALFGVILCLDIEMARSTEAECHGLLKQYRKRGEWFEGDVSHAWDILKRRFSDGALWLTPAYDIDLDAMQLRPFAKGAWGGISDNYHRYADFKKNGVVDGLIA